MSNSLELYWTAFYTKPRNEKKAADRLKSKGFEIYCPTRTVLKQWSDRKKKVIEPVFNSYIFAKVDELTRLEILRDAGIVSNVRWLGQPARIRDNEIVEMRTFLEEYPLSKACSKDFLIGDKTNIETGVLSGQCGIIREVRGSKVVLTISSIGLEIQAEISLNHLKRVS